VVRVRLDRQFPDGKGPARDRDRLFQLVDQDRRRPASHVDPSEIIPEIPVEEQLLAKRPEVVAAEIFLKDKAVEGTVGTEPLAERDMEIEEAGSRIAGGRYVGDAPALETHCPGKFAPRPGGNHGIDQCGRSLKKDSRKKSRSRPER